jgi:transcriptional/translational regulatory protein YebC/TACO1
MFDKKGLITVAVADSDEEELMELAIGAGADDFENTGEVYEITCEPVAFSELKAAIDAKEITTQVAEISMIPQNTVEITNEAVAEKIMALIEEFEDQDDVQNVYSNFDIPEELAAKLGG